MSAPVNMREATFEQLGGVQRAAVLLLSLDTEVAAKLLKGLGTDLVEDVTRSIASAGRVNEPLRVKVLEEFYHVALAQQYCRAGGVPYARALLSRALDPNEADRIIKQVENQVYKRPFSFVDSADGENLLTFIQDEHPQTIALIFSYMAPQKASEVLVGLPPVKQLEVIRRMAGMDQTNPEVVREVERALELRLSGIVSQTFQKVGGVDSVASILNLCDRSTEKTIMESLDAEDPDLVEQIRRLMFVFEDIMLVNDRGIQSVLKEIDNEDLALALRTASDDLKEKIFSNMSERAAQLIREEMEYMGPVRVSDVEAAQQKIVDVVRRLEDSGDLIISGRGGEKESVV